MKNRISKKFLALIVSASLLVVTGIALACAGGDDFMDFYNSFFAPETSHTPESKPFYRSVMNYYEDNSFLEPISIMDSTNVAEWESFFGGKIERCDLDYVIYKSRIGEIDTCIFYLKNNAFPISFSTKESTLSLLSLPDKTLAKEFLFYLGFAKRCEPFATYNPGWWSDDDEADPREDKIAIEKLLAGGKKVLTYARSSFIKERYVFQITRLLYQKGSYEECIEFFNQSKGEFTSGNSSLYRAMGYVAASHYQLEDYSQANYLYSIIFDRCTPMQKIALSSFHPQEESDWEEALALTQNRHEKEGLWHLLGIYADPQRAMQEIYNLNPQSDLLDLLLVRAVNINEEYFIPHQDYWSEEKEEYALKAEKVDEDLLKFSETVADEGKANKLYLWNLVAGYLNLAKGDYKRSEVFLARAVSKAEGDVLVNEQIRSFRILNMIEEYNKPDVNAENELAKELNWLGKEKRDPSLRKWCIYDWALSRLSEKYRMWGDSVKAQCLDYKQNEKFYYIPENMEALIAFMDKPSKTNFENLILSRHPYSRIELFDYKATLLLYQYRFREALEMFDACPGSGDGILYGDPFIIHINDCHDCDYMAEQDVQYTSYTFVQKLLDLQKKAADDPKNASKYYFMIANGLYNMTYYGNAHHVFSSPLIDVQVGYFYFGYHNTADFYQYFDCSKALEYYLKAMDASTDKEFRAQCCFMAAKCEQNQYFSSPEFDYHNAVKSGEYYKRLYKEFSKTDYYQEILNECGYFKMYVEKIK